MYDHGDADDEDEGDRCMTMTMRMPKTMLGDDWGGFARTGQLIGEDWG